MPKSSILNPPGALSGFFVLVAGVSLWVGIYFSLPAFFRRLTRQWLGLNPDLSLTGSLEYFITGSLQVLMLLALVVFILGTFRTFISNEKIHRLLMERGRGTAPFRAVLLGVVTPFDSVSVAPFFINLLKAKVSLRVAFTFLVAAPLVNEVTLIMLFALLGWRITAVYILAGLLIALGAGYLMGKMALENQVERWGRGSPNRKTKPKKLNSWYERMGWGWKAVRDTLAGVWLYVLAGMFLGALIQSWVPESLILALMGKSAWWSLPAAILIGVPVYANMAALIPVFQALLSKGAALGTTLAFMMATTALSFPGIILLRKALPLRLLLIFVGLVTLGILLAGYFFSWLY